MHLPFQFPVLPLVPIALGVGSSAIAQEEQVTLRFLSFPQNASPQPIELLVGEGEILDASKVDIAAMLGGTQFALKPGKHTIQGYLP